MANPDSHTNCSAHDRSCVAMTAAIMNKWTPQLIYAMANGTCRFCELQKVLGGVNPRTLSARLDELERIKVITKHTFKGMPLRTDYELTQKGRDLLPILEQMARWGDKYSSREPALSV